VDALGAIGRIKEAGGAFISVADNFDTSTPAGKLALTMFLGFAEFELDRVREGWNTAQAHAVARGVHVASRVPTGYRKRDDGRLEPDPVGAPVLAELFRRRAAGAGWTQLATFLDESGIQGPYDNRAWTTGAAAKMIQNRVYLGEARSGQHVNAAAHQPIVSLDDWEAAQGKRGRPSIRSGEGLLLSGLVRCAGCRYLVKADSMKDRDGSRLGLYRCRKRHAAGICEAPTSALARVLEPYVERQFLEALEPSGPLAEAAASTAELRRAMEQVNSTQRELDEYRDTTAVSLIGRESFEAGLATRAKAVELARATLAPAKERAGFAASLPMTAGALVEAWPSLTITERRRLVGAAIEAVFVRSVRGSGRASRIDERVVICWRGEAPADLPARGRRLPLSPFSWPDENPREVGMPLAQNL
jgi:site-specific DNA recombinase